MGTPWRDPPDPRAFRPRYGHDRETATSDQDHAAGGHRQRLITRSDNTTALAHVRLVVKKRARRVYGFLAWSEGGKRQEVFLAEATLPTRAGNLAMMWRLVAEQNLLDPAVRSERTAQRRSTWEHRRPSEDPASRP